jgi:hypothetical protein
VYDHVQKRGTGFRLKSCQRVDPSFQGFDVFRFGKLQAYWLGSQIENLVLGGELEQQHFKVALPSVAVVGEQVLRAQKNPCLYR